MSDSETQLNDLEKQLGELKDQLASVLNNFAQNVDKQFKEFQNILEILEQRVAILTVGFGEHSVMIDGLLGQLFFASEEQQEAFKTHVSEARENYLSVMKEGGNVMVPTMPGDSDTVEPVAEPDSPTESSQ